MDDSLPDLGDLEREVMQLVWANGPVTAEAVRAVGHANGSNPISVVVPCHRLIGANGSLVKYGGGLQRKRWLLQHEGVRV